MGKSMITKRLADEWLNYDPLTGIFTWKKKPKSKAQVGDQVGTTSPYGYVMLKVKGKRSAAHRVAWLMHFGEMPRMMIDHINNNPSDNRISNLRLATYPQNGWNRKSNKNNMCGLKGAHFHKATGKYRARIMVNGQEHHLGDFDSAKEAHETYCKAASVFHGDFANFGSAA